MINYSFQLHHRRLRARFRMETLERCALRIEHALYRRIYGGGNV